MTDSCTNEGPPGTPLTGSSALIVEVAHWQARALQAESRLREVTAELIEMKPFAPTLATLSRIERVIAQAGQPTSPTARTGELRTPGTVEVCALCKDNVTYIQEHGGEIGCLRDNCPCAIRASTTQEAEKP